MSKLPGSPCLNCLRYDQRRPSVRGGRYCWRCGDFRRRTGALPNGEQLEQQRRHPGPRPISIEERILRAVTVDEATGCWLWQGSTLKGGYAAIAVGSLTDGARRTRLAHRIAYEQFVGPIPEGLTLDHLCRVTPVTQAENNRRGIEARKALAAA